jgi:hypothetical protein
MLSQKTAIVCAAAAALCFFGATTQAAIYNVSTLNGSEGFTYDGDSTAPQVTANGFYSSGVAGEYHAVRVAPADIGLSGLTLGDIQSIAYDTKQVGGAMDWQAIVYTVDQNGSGGGWYGVRFKYGLNDGTDHDWATTTRDFTHPLDRIINGSTAGFDKTEYILANSPTQYDNLLAAAQDQQVLHINFYLGASDGGHDFDSYLNNIHLDTTLGDVTINAVPEPSGLALVVGLGGLALLSRRSRRV